MAKSNKEGKLSKRNKWIIGIIVAAVLFIAFVLIFAVPSAESVFKDMNSKMLQTKTVTVDQKMTMKGTGEITSRMYLDMNSSQLNAKGNFSMTINSEGVPIKFEGDVVRVGESSFVRFNTISSSDKRVANSLSLTESKLKNNWIKIRDKDRFASIAKSSIDFSTNILPIPFANLNDTQRKNVLDILQDKKMYTINESSQVEIGGVSAYKYMLFYDENLFKNVTKLISNYASYFKSDESEGDKVTSITAWVDITTKQIIKLEYTGKTSSGDEITGTISFSSYNKAQSVKIPGDYSIESELLN